MPHSPLHEDHVRLGARFVDFAGWEMPVQYVGVIAEHEAVRNHAGVFDVSHLGRFSVEGPGSTDLLLELLCNNITHIEPGRAQYTMSLNEDGGVLDDIIVWRWDTDRYWVIPNGANDDAIRARFAAAAPSGVSIEPIRTNTAMLALQGPESPAIFESVLGVVPGRFRLGEGTFHGRSVAVAGTGYTGERGGEIVVEAEAASDLFAALLDAGATACGLGSRDTLRLEMGYPLYGQDLDPETTPLEADLGWVVAWDHDFVGKAALEQERNTGLRKKLEGFVMPGRKIARHGYPMRSESSTGSVASGNFSPTLGRGIGMGYLAPPIDADSTIEVEVRGEWIPVERKKPPFKG